MKKTFLLVVIGCFAVTASCTTPHPKLKFFKLDSNYSIEDTKDKLTFKMPSPVIAITVQENKEEKPPWKPVFTSTVTSREGMYAIQSADSWYVETKYTIAYQQNSFLVKSLSVELTDNRLKYIQEVGSIVAAAIPLIALVAVKPPALSEEESLEVLRKNLPYNVKVADCFGSFLDDPPKPEDAGKPVSKKVSCETKIMGRKGEDTGWKATIVADRNNQKSLVSYDTFFTKDGYVSTDFPVPDCKEGFVFLEYNGEIRFSSPITFANPTRLTTVPIPAKGSITYHPVCSADTVSSTADVAKPLELLKTTIDQVATAKKAYDEATKKK